MPNDDDRTPPAGSDPAGDAIRRRLTRAADPASDPAGAYDRVVAKRASRRVRRRVGTIALGVAVVAATAGGTFALTRVFGGGVTPQPAASTSTGFANGLIAFVSSGSVRTMTPTGVVKQVLTPTSLVAQDPAWSTDGARIAFAAFDSGANPELTRLYVMRADGTGLQVVVGGGYVEPAWSNDGRSLYFVEGAVGHAVFEVRIDGGPIINVADLGCAVTSPAVSPSGSIAVRVTCRGSLPRIEILSADGAHRTPVPGTQGTTSGPAWSPDGSSMAFATTGAIHTVAADGTHLRTLHTGLLTDELAYAPDGTKIVFSDISRTHEGGPGLYTVNTNGSGLTRLAPTNGAQPSWQPVPLGGGATASPTTAPTTSPTPSTTTTTPTPTPSPSPSASSDVCPMSTVTADFDGDGTQDTATVDGAGCGPEGSSPRWTLSVTWGNGASGSWELAGCTDASCGAVGSIPMNDGTNALVLRTHEGASTVFYQLLNLLPAETGPQPYGVVDPGAPGFPTGQTAEFPDVGSVSHQAFFRCQGGPYPGGGDQATIVETTADLSNDQTTYTVTETILAHGPNAGKPELTVVSQTSKDVAFDVFDPANDVVGVPCWGPGSGSPSP